ncbi:mitochondrial processing peptidase beta subunit [Datura stramonium]|uniref:Mitochondrial processing peptidase beta subunit n=1 Tax=Datura stramonium TaxID=4076 RepID=A0ABS8V5D2_DATST|nr:mitochondrial processing peptidase beta subunit [Datura stramonium]
MKKFQIKGFDKTHSYDVLAECDNNTLATFELQLFSTFDSRLSEELLSLQLALSIIHHGHAPPSQPNAPLSNYSLHRPPTMCYLFPILHLHNQPCSTSLPTLPPLPPDSMIYDRLAEQAPETKVTTLPNGLRVATESNLSSQTATVGVWIDAGSRFETEENNGEQTTYFAKVLGSDVPKAIDILGDILQNSLLEEDKIVRERSVILREMEEIEYAIKASGATESVFFQIKWARGDLKVVANNHLCCSGSGMFAQRLSCLQTILAHKSIRRTMPEEVIFDQLHTTAFQYTPLGRTILGPAQNIEKMTRAHIQDYISTHYGAHRMVISAAGAVKHEDIVEQVKKHFTKLSSNPLPLPNWWQMSQQYLQVQRYVFH